MKFNNKFIAVGLGLALAFTGTCFTYGQFSDKAQQNNSITIKGKVEDQFNLNLGKAYLENIDKKEIITIPYSGIELNEGESLQVKISEESNLHGTFNEAQIVVEDNSIKLIHDDPNHPLLGSGFIIPSIIENKFGIFKLDIKLKDESGKTVNVCNEKIYVQYKYIGGELHMGKKSDFKSQQQIKKPEQTKPPKEEVKDDKTQASPDNTSSNTSGNTSNNSSSDSSSESNAPTSDSNASTSNSSSEPSTSTSESNTSTSNSSSEPSTSTSDSNTSTSNSSSEPSTSTSDSSSNSASESSAQPSAPSSIK